MYLNEAKKKELRPETTDIFFIAIKLSSNIYEKPPPEACGFSDFESKTFYEGI